MPSTLTALAATRSAIGASAWLMPNTAGKLFGMDVTDDDSAGLFLRLGGTRDFALAAGPIVGDRSTMLKVAGACDVADMIATLIARREGKLSPLSTAMFLGGSIACLVMVGKALREEQDAAATG